MKARIVKRDERADLRRRESMPDDLKRLTRSLQNVLRSRYPDAEDREIMRVRVVQELAEPQHL